MEVGVFVRGCEGVESGWSCRSIWEVMIVGVYIIYIHMYIYSKTSLTDYLHRSNTPLYRSVYFGLKPSPIQII